MAEEQQPPLLGGKEITALRWGFTCITHSASKTNWNIKPTGEWTSPLCSQQIILYQWGQSCQNKLSWQLPENSDPFLALGFSSPEVIGFHHQEIKYIHHQTKRLQSSLHITDIKSCSFYGIYSNCSHFLECFLAQEKWVKFNFHCK